MPVPIQFMLCLFIVTLLASLAAAQPCLTGADDPARGGDCNGAVNITELIDYIGEWYRCSACVPDLFQAIEAYYGIYTTPQPDFPADYVSWWKFDGDADDEPGINNGTFTGSATTVYDAGRDYGNGTNGHVLFMDNPGDIVSVPTNPLLNVGNFTISLWMNLQHLYEYQTLFSKGHDAYGFGIVTDNRLSFEGEINSNRVRSRGYGFPKIIHANVWYHVALVWNGTNHTFYLDGSSPSVGTCYSSTLTFTPARGESRNFGGNMNRRSLFKWVAGYGAGAAGVGG